MILLDTCAIIWDALDPGKLSSAAVATINGAGSDLMICDISIWEIALLIKKNRLSAESSAAEFVQLVVQARNFRIQAITPAVAELSVNFGLEINPDPADRLIAATSILFNAPVITADKNLRDAPLVETVW